MGTRTVLKWILAAIAAAVAGLLIYQAPGFLRAQRQSMTREALFEELSPVSLVGCEMERFGSKDDGGYLLCGNLLGDAEVAYSYGIAGRDSWGCSISQRYGITVHQYDCFDTSEPTCPGGVFAFHPECVGDRKETIDEREFDSVAGQMARNGDSGKRTVVKMDVEGAEWASLLATPDALLDDIEQLVLEFHRVNEESYLDVVRKLKEHFYVANLHFNNWACKPGIGPFPSWAYEVLFVNKRLVERDESGSVPTLPHPLDRPNTADRPDCQLAARGGEAAT